jgi:hypothetical protein
MVKGSMAVTKKGGIDKTPSGNLQSLPEGVLLCFDRNEGGLFVPESAKGIQPLSITSPA